MVAPADDRPMELEPPVPGYSTPPKDRRPHMPPPPPVRLMAVEDVRAFAVAGLEAQLDDFYISLLHFEREESDADGKFQFYKAENVRLVMEIVEPPIDRPDMRPIAVEVSSLQSAEAGIIDRELEYERLRGLTAGSDSLLLQDPAGNWVSISENRGVR
jgi:hypothetical protein